MSALLLFVQTVIMLGCDYYSALTGLYGGSTVCDAVLRATE
jgi:urea transporter